MAAVYYTVKSGDTLSEIAEKYDTTVAKLAKLNNIENVDLIYVGEQLLISGASAPTKKKVTESMVRISRFGLQSGTDRTIFITWDWDKDHTDRYKVWWYYATGNGVWFLGSKNDDLQFRHDTYTAPQNATAVKVKIQPISYKHKVNGKEVYWWTAQWSNEKKYYFKDPPAVPSTPTLEVQDRSTSTPKMTVSVTGLDGNTDYVRFQVVKNDKTRIVDKKIPAVRLQASYDFKVSIGAEYKARCSAIGYNGAESDMSAYTENVGTLPANVGKITTIKAKSDKYVYVEWPNIKTAETYELQYTTEKTYFDSNPSGVQSVTIDAWAASHADVELDFTKGDEYFFRVRAVNDAGPSAWTPVKSIVIGKEPSAPTTWSSTNTAVLGNWIFLYWVHNTEDGTPQTEAEIEITEDGKKRVVKKEYNPNDDTDTDLTKQLSIDTDTYKDGTVIEWRVRTKGILNDFSPWSVKRTIEVFEMPYVDIDLINANGAYASIVRKFPFTIELEAGPKAQTPLGYSIEIAPTTTYTTVNNLGEEVTIKKNQIIYSKYVNSKAYKYTKQFTPGDIDLAPDVTYKITATVSMDSGLRGSQTTTFKTIWDDDRLPEPNAEIGIRNDSLEAVIRPYCEKYESHNYKLDIVDGEYVSTKTKLSDEDIMSMVYVPDAYVNDKYQVYEYTDINGDVGYCADIEDDEPTLLKNVTLSVYRREYDGTFTTIRTNMANVDGKYTVDSHPALDYARYRIVATSTETGEVSFFDAPAYPVGEKAVVINWNEEWTDFFDYGNPDEMEEQPFDYSMIKIPYNIDVSSNYQPDVSMIEYIGREHPVSYYGTHIGETATWNVEIPKTDEETLYGLRRLARWMGDAYVREPSGTGYWAHVEVSFSQKHRELTIPVTFSITRVEGGE